MAGRTVTAPTGERWRVRRQWVPRLGSQPTWRRVSRRFRPGARLREFTDIADPGCAFDALDGLVLAVALVSLVVLVVFFVVPLVIAVVELLAVVLLLVGGVVAKVAFRRPWSVHAEALDGVPPARSVTWRVVGWRASGAHVDAVATALASGADLPTDGTSPPPHPAPR